MHRTFFEKGVADPYGDPLSNGVPVEKGVSDAFVDVRPEVKQSA